MKYLSFIVIALLVVSCKNDMKVRFLSEEDVVNKSIDVSGGAKFDKAKIEFVFRAVSYTATRDNGKFELTRLQVKDDKSIFDFITNSGYKRIVDGLPVKVADSMAVKYTASINSVHYFSTLPHGLNDKAVNKTLLGEEQINNKTYYKIKVTFNQEGGGEDYEDVFIYWIDKASFKLSYLAYSYNEDDGVGMRFREANNERYVNGIRFVDYNNYKAENTETKLTDLGKAFENNQLKLLSKIELENVSVDLIDL